MEIPFILPLLLLFCWTDAAHAAWPKGVRQDACLVWRDTGVILSRPFEKQRHAYLAHLDRLRGVSDTPGSPDVSPFLLCEGNRLIGRPHVEHDEIRRLGRGRFSHWQTNLYFSTSDNTDPDFNGREYSLVREPVQNQIAPTAPPRPGAGSGQGREPIDPDKASCAGDFKAPLSVVESHVHDTIMAGEHTAALALVSDCAVTDLAVRAGSWSNPQIWRDRRVPGLHARVLIPAKVDVVFDTTRDSPVLDWIRVDGRLTARTDRDTTLTLRTLIVTGSGRFELGTASAPVPDSVKVRLDFVPRQGRNRSIDPFDLDGGLISQGRVQMVAAPKTPHLQAGTLFRQSSRIEFTSAPRSWRVGDLLLIPGTDAWTDQDEVRAISAVHEGGRRVDLDQPLWFDHTAPASMSIRIGNLTRNIELRSVVASPLESRAHVMFMHAQTGTLVDGAAFIDLGRTDTRMGHTIPVLGPDGRTKPGTDSNTIGRYPVHFHVRSGARTSVPPHVIRNSVVINSPKFGIVNHGGHVLVEDNITFRVEGSHLVAENGSEIGAFRGNMAVRSNGSGDPSILSRMGIYDNAHGGNGIWLTSGGVAVVDNWASGHADSGFKMLASRFFEQGKEVFFDGGNIGNPPYADSRGRVSLMDVDLHLRGNVFVASVHGMEIWNHKEIESHDAVSTVDDTAIWNVQSNAVFVPYTRNTTFRNLQVWGQEGAAREAAGVGVDGNRATSDITIEGGQVRGLAVGLRLPQRGRNIVRNLVLDNSVDLEIRTAEVPGRRIHLDRVEFQGQDRRNKTTISMGPPEMPFSGDAAVLFSNDRIDWTDKAGRNQRIYFEAQQPGAVPFMDVGPAQLRGLTNLEVQRKFGLVLAGATTPEAAVRLARSNALAVEAAVPRFEPRVPLGPSGPRPVNRALYDPYDPSASLTPPSLSGTSEREWQAVRSRYDKLVSQGRLEHQRPSRFMLHPSLLPLEIHPDDIQFGYRILGYVVDDVYGRVRMIAHFEEFHGLKVDPDGFVRVRSRISSVYGKYPPQEIAIRVSRDAVQRGGNLDAFLQAKYCGACGFDIVEASAERVMNGPEAARVKESEPAVSPHR